MVMSKQIGKAMVASVTRANNDPDYLHRRVAELEAENERLRQIIRESKVQRIDVPYSGDKQLYDGRPVITPSQAAQQCRVSKSTVSRYLESGHWEGTQVAGTNRWWVFTDKGLPVKTRGKKKVQ